MRTDAELLCAYAAAADPAAFEEIVRRHGPMVIRACARLLGNAHDAEDAAQAVFLVLARKAGSLGGSADVAGWLHGTARNAARWTARARHRRARHEQEAAMVMANAGRDGGRGAGGETSRSESLTHLDRELARLPAPERQAVILRHLEGRSQKEAAELAGCPENTLGSRAARGLERLRERLSCGGGPELSAGVLAGVLAGEAQALSSMTLLPSLLAVSRGIAASAAMAGGAGKASLIAEGVLKMMLWTKVKLVAVVVMAACLLGSAVPITVKVLAAAEPAKDEEARPDIAAAVPADALAFVRIAPRERWKKALAESTPGAVCREEEVSRLLAPAFEKIESVWDRTKAALAGKDNKTPLLITVLGWLDELHRAARGDMGMALLEVKANGEPVWLLAADIGDRADGLAAMLQDIHGEFGKLAPAKSEIAVYRGVGIASSSVDRGKTANVATGLPNMLCQARCRGLFLLSPERSAIEKAIDTIEKACPSFDGGTALKPSEGDLVTLGVNLAGIIKRERARGNMIVERGTLDTVTGAITGNLGTEVVIRNWQKMDALGLTAAKQLSFRLDFDKPLFREKLSLDVSEAKGLLSLLNEAQPADTARLAADAPADALLFVAARLPMEKAHDTLFKTLEAIAPREAEAGRQQLRLLKEQGLDVEALLDKSLTGEVALWAAMPPAGAGVIPEVVAVLRTKDNAAIEGVIQALARNSLNVFEAYRRARAEIGPEPQPPAIPANESPAAFRRRNEEDFKRQQDYRARLNALVAKYALETRERYHLEPIAYKGGELYALPQEHLGGIPFQVTALLLPGKVVFASSASAAKRAATPPAAGASLAGKPAFKDGLAKLDPGASAVYYLDMPRTFGLAYGAAAPFLSAGDPGNRLKKDWGLDPTLFPPPEAVSKHLLPEVGALHADSRGLRIENDGNVPTALLLASAAGYGITEALHNQRYTARIEFVSRQGIQIQSALQKYAVTHGNRFPDKLSDLYPRYVDSLAPFFPSGAVKTAADIDAQGAWEYLGRDRRKGDADRAVLFYEKGMPPDERIMVYRMDGSGSDGMTAGALARELEAQKNAPRPVQADQPKPPAEVF